MTLRELLKILSEPDFIDKEEALNLEVKFCTSSHLDLDLLSVYSNREKTNIY